MLQRSNIILQHLLEWCWNNPERISILCKYRRILNIYYGHMECYLNDVGTTSMMKEKKKISILWLTL